MEVYLSNPLTGEKKKSKRGFSWTTFFFGFWPALFRGDSKWALIGFLICLSSIVTIVSSLIYCIVGGFKYNEWYVNELREKGFVEVSSAEFYGVSQPMVEQVAPA